jgi:uncharacterized protein (TIRG00374 family)
MTARHGRDGSRPGPRVSVGDRVERAIADHADAEREIERAEAEARPGSSLRRTVVWLAITGVSLYLVAPTLIDVLGSAEDLDRLEPGWFAAMAVLQTLSLACLWAVQRAALNDPEWPPVILSQLAGNALAKIAPGGGALGAALQYRLLVEAGIERGRAVAGITAVNLLTFAVVLALPVLAIPAFIRGAVDRGLVEATVIGLVVFAVLLALGVLMLAWDGPLEWVGRRVQGIRNRLRWSAEPMRGLPARLRRERDRLLATLGPRWKLAVAASVGRWAFDYATLLAALAALGSTPRPALVLLAFCAAQVLAQIPITPGGVGFVEAGLTATLALAGVGAADAVLATLAYRLFTYWLPLPVGLAAFTLHRKRLARAA